MEHTNHQYTLPVLDEIRVRDLVVRNRVGVDNWERAKPQPLRISLSVHTDVDGPGAHDQLTDSVHYGVLTRAVTEFAEACEFRSMEALAVGIARLTLNTFGGPKGARRVDVDVEKPRSLLHAECAGIRISRSEAELAALDAAATRDDPAHHPQSPTSATFASPSPAANTAHGDQIYIRDLSISTIIGVNPWEREEKQLVVLNLTLFPPAPISGRDRVHRAYNYRLVAAAVQDYVERSAFKTIEALCHHVARLAVERLGVFRITVSIEKPSALIFAKSSGVVVTRDRAWLAALKAREAEAAAAAEAEAAAAAAEAKRAQGSTTPTAGLAETPAVIPRPKIAVPTTAPNVVYLALGSNLGDRAGHIHRALRLVVERATAILADTSFLYETPAMYVTDQPAFLNAAAKIYTPLSPLDLLDALKSIEADMGRTDTGRNGPRPIDLDILLYNDVVMNTPRLEIPHPRIAEREFVLRPLAEYAPQLHLTKPELTTEACSIAADLEHPTHFRSIAKLLALVQHTAPADSPIYRVMPLSPTVTWDWGSRTRVMGILNVTPDSFSDGGDHLSVDAAVAAAKTMVAAGADMIDIGGQSTRPGAVEVGHEEELRRVLPAIKAIRAAGLTVALSVDTYLASVAAAAVAAGANLVNDVTGGRGDPGMLAAVAKLQVPYCVMHMRGDPTTMTKLTSYADGVLRGVAAELAARVQAALQAGIHRWNVMVDPGIGFAKAGEQNFALVAQLPELIRLATGSPSGFPVLVGPSRKRFIGDATGKTVAKDRAWGTAAAVAACVAGGADVVRVHDVAEMRDVVVVADRVWRPKRV
ncbi:trifunctional dihydropteroate synthetase [Blastocladiella emersonii ATCC 22665]|nr:trifunctional dihydropteroate synthetase [Blastocladiella emersonii ATCC 22665]